MDIFDFFTMFGGLAFFLYGMTVMSSGLEKIAGGKLESTLKKMTSNPFKSLLLGAGITIAIQSSSAMTVMLVGLVNSGIMTLGQTIGVIMGSNIGTTLTAWILSLAGIGDENIFLRLLKPDSFSPIVALIGVLMIMMYNGKKNADIGRIFVGFAILMFGMELMGDSVNGLAESESFASILIAFSNPIVGVIVGAVFTGVIQSSAASVGILQALSLTGQISYGMAIPIIMGQNIGTCVTSLISSIGVNKNAKRVAAVHILFNLIGTVILLVAFYAVDYFIKFSFIDNAIDPVQVALVHTVFNVVTTIMLFPFSKHLGKLATMIVRDNNKEEVYELLDERLFATPSVAVGRCREITVEMGRMAITSFTDTIDMLMSYDDKKASEIEKVEAQTDLYEDKLGSYLVKLSRESLSVDDSHETSKMLYCIGDFERIGDHACNMLLVSKEIRDKEITFSPEAQKGIETMSLALKEITDLTLRAFAENDLDLAKKVEPLEQVIDRLQTKLKSGHTLRLKQGECTIEMGFVFNDLLNNYERVADHCSNIAVCLIQIAEDQFETHGYLSNIKSHGDDEFDKQYKDYKEKYSL
ncbi:MAG: Na/Pi cotransporter family protein [Eubacteriales bacterium]|nr:Na/Pi cotransporter family protein [Eubacteriales bacterium]